MDNMEIGDFKEMERQRYNYIKDKGKYMEVKILIGDDKDSFKGHSGIIPVITTELHNAGPRQVACMYLSLSELINKLEKDYPVECIMAKTTMASTAITEQELSMTNDEEEE